MNLISQEFFSQGDLEKMSSGHCDMEMVNFVIYLNIQKFFFVQMDRERARVPKIQLKFMDSIAIPAFQLLADVSE